MEHHDARSVVLDVSSVETLDSFFVRTLSETARMVKLIGGRTIVAGIGPAVEETAARVGVSLENIETALSVDRALEHAATDAPARRF